MLLAVISIIAAQSCEDRFPTDIGVKITTLDVTKVSLEGYTFNATLEWTSNEPVLGDAGVFYSRKPHISMKNLSQEPIYTTPVKKLLSSVLNINSHIDNYTSSPGKKTYTYQAGETIYYRAYLKISQWNPKQPDVLYYYGEEKSFVIPNE